MTKEPFLWTILGASLYIPTHSYPRQRHRHMGTA